MSRSFLPAELSRGAFRTRTALQQGVSPKRLRAADLWTPTSGVRTRDIPITLLERVDAFSVAAPNEFAFSHVTAAQLLGMPLSYATEEDVRVHIITPTDANRVRRSLVCGHRGLETREVVTVHGFPVVCGADTWADLGELVGPGKPVGLDDLIVAGDAAANLMGSVSALKRGRGGAGPSAREGDTDLRPSQDSTAFGIRDGDPL